VVDLLVIDNETGGSILKAGGGYEQGVIGAHRYPERDTNMHVLYDDTVGEKGLGQMRRCSESG